MKGRANLDALPIRQTVNGSGVICGVFLFVLMQKYVTNGRSLYSLRASRLPISSSSRLQRSELRCRRSECRRHLRSERLMGYSFELKRRAMQSERSNCITSQFVAIRGQMSHLTAPPCTGVLSTRHPHLCPTSRKAYPVSSPAPHAVSKPTY